MKNAPSRTIRPHGLKPIFRDPSLEEELRNKGYVVVPFIEDHAIANLLKWFHRTNKEYTSRRLYETSRANSSDLNREIGQQIYEAFRGPSDRYFLDFNLWGGSFLAKTHLNNSEFRLHQDWSVVDEPNVNSAIIWCPLTDVRVENGAIFVIEGSHDLFDNIRSGSLPPLRVSASEELSRYYKPLPMAAGQALIFYDRLFHGSYPNITGELRVVAQGRVMQDDGQLLYFHKEREGFVNVYEVNFAFYNEQINLLDKGEIPEHLRPVETIPYHRPSLTVERLLEGVRGLATPGVYAGRGTPERGD